MKTRNFSQNSTVGTDRRAVTGRVQRAEQSQVGADRWAVTGRAELPEQSADIRLTPLNRFQMPPRQSQIANRKSQEGMALVITLILLSVTLVMAIAFLAISRRERNSVSTVTDQTTATFAADAALAKAEARIVSQMLVTTNPYVFSLAVSTNYINRAGFTNGLAALDNVNYDYNEPLNGGGLLTADERVQNIANLFYDPRPPVYYSNDFRFYLDLNRNGRFDTNGVVTNFDNNLNGLGTVTPNAIGDPEWIGILEHPDQPHGPNNPFIARYCFIAVPANSLDFNYIHNQAMGDQEGMINDPSSGTGKDEYSRDQGVGTWELNLAAFLADLNTNSWDPLTSPYLNLQPSLYDSVAFDDARSLLAWRYNNYYPLMASADNIFGTGLGDYGLRNNGIDYYDLGRQFTFDTNFAGYGNPSEPWLGSPPTNNYFGLDADLFNMTKADLGNTRVSDSFATNLYDAGTNNSTYDRYTFYRMLGQIGTDTLPASGKINLNYQNAIVNYNFGAGDLATNIPTSIAIVPNGEANFQSWSPHDFFTAAANQLLTAYTTEWFESSPSNYLRNYYGLILTNALPISAYGFTNCPYLGMTNQLPSFGVTNIPVYVNGSYVYSPAVNRLLQLAANIYDASTNTSTEIDSNYPSVFRPIFWKTNEYSYVLGRNYTNIYIKGFQYIQEPLNVYDNGPVWGTPIELTDTTQPFGILTSNVWGVPWIVGAKKGFPNFNGFELDSTFFIERELQFTRNSSTPEPSTAIFPFGRQYTTNQEYYVGISNSFAMEDWNSYINQYGGAGNDSVSILAKDFLTLGLTNSDSPPIVDSFYTNSFTFPVIKGWPGLSFAMPFGTNVTVFPNLSSYPSTNGLYLYYPTPTATTVSGVPFTGPCFIPNSLNPPHNLNPGAPRLPQFGLMYTNHLQAYMEDTDSGGNVHLLDYVQLGDMNGNLNVNAAIADPDSSGLWSTNYYSGSTVPMGVDNQILLGFVGHNVPSEDLDAGGLGGHWTQQYPGTWGQNDPPAQASFQAFFSASNQVSYTGGAVSNFDLSVQAPFTPMREIVERFVYRANDPLVHYLTSDLNDFNDDTSNRVAILAGSSPNTNGLKYLGQISDRYLPWGSLNPGTIGGGSPIHTLLPTTYPYGYPPQAVPVDQNQYNYAYKDPLVWSADNWDFPTNKYPNVGWLGRVHRGTPWQTVYLKSPDIWEAQQTVNSNALAVGAATWQVWTGDANAQDAYNEDPRQDRLLFDLFTAAPDDDATRGEVNVNIGADDPTDPLAGLASWSSLLSGILLTSNSANNYVIGHPVDYESPVVLAPWYQRPPSYLSVTSQPLGPAPYPGGNITNSPMWQVVDGINSTRTNFLGVEKLPGVFEHVGDILATPQLSVASPFLNWNIPAQQDYGISDEMYEWLPQQIMSLLTVSGTPQSPPRYVVYCYGQTLKPAPNSFVTGGPYAGMCTNYQVTAESAARAVIRIVNAPTPANPTATPHVVVEQYNPLPPE